MVDYKNYNSYYEQVGNQYNHLRLDAKNDRENVICLLKKYVPIEKAKILDIGCGTGKYGEMMEENGYQVVGVDKSETQFNQAKELIEAYHCDATCLPFANNSFEACTMIIVIQQMSKEERIKVFLEAYRVLKSKGMLIIKTCSHDDLNYRFTAKFFPKTLEIDKARYPDIDELKNELSMFFEIEVEPSSIIVEKSKEKYINQYKNRGTSNFSFLTDEEIDEGIKRFEKTYKNQKMIQKVVKNTFVIARKD